VTNKPSEPDAGAQLIGRLKKLADRIRLVRSKYPHLGIVRLSSRNGHEDDLSITTAKELIEDLELAIRLIQPGRSDQS
jgi:hypothetical protein